MEALNSIKIIGKGTITGGEYDKIAILGEAISLEHFKCRYLNVIGNCTLKEESISDNVKILGEIICEKLVTTGDELEILGKLKAANDYKVNKIKVLGEGNFDKNLIFEKADILGELIVGGECEGNQFISRGRLNISGLLSAENIDISPNSISTINEIGGSKIIIKKGLFSFGKGKVITNIIEGDYVELENTECKVVRGHDIKILANCKIDKIEYTGTLTVSGGSIVGEESCLKN